MENSIRYSIRRVSAIPVEKTSYSLVRTPDERRREMDRLIDMLPCEMVVEAAAAMLAEPEFPEGYEDGEIGRYEAARTEFSRRVESERSREETRTPGGQNLGWVYESELTRVELHRLAASMSDDLLVDSGLEVLCSSALLDIPEYLAASELDSLRIRSLLSEIDASPVFVEARKGFSIWLEFSDGVKGELNLSEYAGRDEFSAWCNREFFEGVHIDEFGFITWGNVVPDDSSTELDIESGVLYAQLLGFTRDEVREFGEKAEFSAEIERRRERYHAKWVADNVIGR